MSVRFDNAADMLTRSATLPSATTFTCCCWANISTDRNAVSAVFSFDDGGSSYAELATNTDGTTMMVWPAGTGGATLGVSMAVGTWYFVALSKSGVNLTGYIGAATAAGLSSASLAETVGFTPTNLYIGNDGFAGADFWNGRIAAFKLWDGVALTEAELLQERWQYMPARTSGLWTWLPMLSATSPGVDYGGGARDFTVGGTLATEDGPPIAWKQGRLRPPILPVAAAADAVPQVWAQYRRRRAA